MPKRLLIKIGPHRDATEVAWVNDSSKPTIIDNDLFVGRVLIKIRDFQGMTPDGTPPNHDHPYFEGRNRRFDIQIEGRFKARPGVQPYKGDEIQFGTDFDAFLEFPMTPFRLGMRVAKSIDPNTYYDFNPPSGRPFIMSPYLACMNTFAAWPSPARYGDALVSLQHPPGVTSAAAPTHLSTRARSVSIQDLVPVEASRQAKKYWHFLGLRRDARIEALAKKHAHLFPDPAIAESGGAPAAKRPMPKHQISFGTRTERDENEELANREYHEKLMQAADQRRAQQQQQQQQQQATEAPKKSRFSSITSRFGALSRKTTPQTTETSPHNSEGEDELAPLPVRHVDSVPLPSGVPDLKGLAKGDLTWADTLRLPSVNKEDPVEAQLGPWRFENPASEPMEDNTFVFLDQNVPVAKRRKHFSKAEALKSFTYDPDVVYSSSFFAPFMNFNTFDLAIGPVSMNLEKYFSNMPVRYTLRSTRLAEGSEEEEVFATISFQLVDEP